MAEFKYEITKHIGVLSEGKNGWKKELNMVSWSEREPKFDIRDWSEDHSKMRKGISLSAEEVAVLMELFEEVDL